MATKITLTEAAAVAIQALQHKNGTFSYYSSNLRRISNSILYLSDEMGMSDSETVETLRVSTLSDATWPLSPTSTIAL